MVSKRILFVMVLALIGEPAVAQPAADQAECQKRADKVASAAGVPTPPVTDGQFFVTKDKVATVYGECKGSLFVSPDPEPFDVRLSPSYPGMVVRVAVAAFDLKAAEVKQAIDACLRAAVDDPPQHSGRAGFARQRWRNSQMTGNILAHRLKWECTYHNSDKAAASVMISKID